MATSLSRTPPAIGPIFADVRPDIECAASGDFPALISGGDASQRSALAFLIHQCSDRASGPFVLIERAPDTNARIDDALMWAAAESGTVCLEEVGDWDWNRQTELLHIVGRRNSIARQPRLLATTGLELYDCVMAGGFQADLFYRLNAVHLSIPRICHES